MRAIIFDTELSLLKFEDEVNTLRLCYMIADRICVGGFTGTNFTFERDAKRYKIPKKVGFMILLETKRDFDNKGESNLKELQDFLALTKDIKAFKHPPQNLLFAYNAAGKILGNYFDDYVDSVVAIWKTKGYLDVVSLKEDETIIETILTEFSAGEWTQTLKSAPLNAKKILEALFPVLPNEPSLLVFPKEFLIEKDVDLDNSIDEIKIMTSFKFLDPASLTALQLKAIREQLKESGQLFRKNIDNWIRSFNGTTEVKELNHLEESLKIFQIGINSNQLLLDNQNRVNLDAETFTIKIGVATLQSVWNYYRKYKILDDFTIEELINQTYHNSSYPQRLPFLCILPNYINKEKMDELNKVVDAGISIQHKKKFLEF